MRVVAGKARRMRLECPAGRDVRPVPEMAREAIFNILHDMVEGASLLDLFAGAGTVGIEALSRGAEWCVFVERSPNTRQVLEKNLAHTKLAEFCDVLQRDAFRCVEALKELGRRFDLIYLGPPFSMYRDPVRRNALLDLAGQLVGEGLLKDGGLVIMQHELRTGMPETIAQLRLEDRRTYGRNAFSFYARTHD